MSDFVIGIDPSLRKTGIVLYTPGKIHAAVLIRTGQKRKGSRPLLKGQEDIGACGIISNGLENFINEARLEHLDVDPGESVHNTLCAAVEAAPPFKGSRSSLTSGLAMGAIVATCHTVLGSAPFGLTAEEVRCRDTHQRLESKAEMVRWASRLGGWNDYCAQLPKTMQEHMADAAGAAAASIRVKRSLGLWTT